MRIAKVVLLAKRIFICLFILSGNNLTAQDFQYSLYQFTPLNVNPAMVAADNSQDAALIYRHQQLGQESALRSTQLNITHPLFLGKVRKAGIGFHLTDDRTGETFFFRKQSFSTALGFSFGLGGNNSLNIGLAGGYIIKSIDNAGWQTGSQWTGGRFNSALPTGEDFEFLKNSSFNLNSGIYFRSAGPDGKEKSYVGFSFLHANKPPENFGLDQKLPSTFLINGGITVWQNGSFAFMPQVLFTNRAAHNFLNIGGKVNYSLQQVNSGILNSDGSLDLGVSYVNEKALVIALTLNQPNYNLGFSYDIDFNPQSEVRSFRGAPEIALRVYRDLEGELKKAKKKKPAKKKVKKKKKRKTRTSKKPVAKKVVPPAGSVPGFQLKYWVAEDFFLLSRLLISAYCLFLY